MSQKRLSVLLSFTHGPDHDVADLAGAVIAGLKGNPAFPSLPVDLAVVETTLAEFTAAISAANQGGPKDRAVRDKRRHELVSLLRQLANYVQGHCNDDLATLLSSGFLARSTNRASTPLPTPVILNIVQGNAGQLLVTVRAIRNARTYDLRHFAGGPGNIGTNSPWQIVSGFTSSRSMLISGLTPGTTYTVQARALGASGETDWSDPVSHICM
jgi:hypothetical protein